MNIDQSKKPPTTLLTKGCGCCRPQKETTPKHQCKCNHSSPDAAGWQGVGADCPRCHHGDGELCKRCRAEIAAACASDEPWERTLVPAWRRYAMEGGFDDSNEAIVNALANEVWCLSEVCDQFTTPHERSKVHTELLGAVTHLNAVCTLIQDGMKHAIRPGVTECDLFRMEGGTCGECPRNVGCKNIVRFSKPLHFTAGEKAHMDREYDELQRDYAAQDGR